MTFTHQDIQTHLIDFLYGELDADTRTAFQSHVDGCTSCRDELVEFQQTQRVTRAHLAESMNEALPEGLHSRLLALAGPAAATAAKAPATAVSPTDGGAAKRTPQQEGLWNRLLALWTRPWALPTLGTLAAAAVFLLVRETIFREARHSLSDQTSVTAPRESAAPTSVAPGSVSMPAREGSAKSPAAGEALKALDDDVRAPSDLPARESARKAADATGGLRELKAASPSGERTGERTHAASSRGGRPSGPAATAKASAGKRQSRAVAATAISDSSSDLSELAGSSADRFADKDVPAQDSPLGSLGASGASRGGGAAPKATRSEVEDSEEESAPRKKESAPPRIAVVAPPPAPRARPAAPTAEPPASPSAPASAASAAPAAQSRRAIADLSPTPEPSVRPTETSRPDGAASAETPIVRAARAEKFMATGAWNQASAIYKALLKDFPRDAAVPVWRRRLADAETAAKRSGSSFAQPPAPSAK